MTVSVGQQAPDFELASADDRRIKLSDFRGKSVVLYFYPKSFSPGCSKQACSLRDGYAELVANNVEVIGISVDDVETQRRFRDENVLKFPVLSDHTQEVSKRYGVAGMTRPDGTFVPVARRVTFVIDPKGVVRQVIDPATADAHIGEVLEALRVSR